MLKVSAVTLFPEMFAAIRDEGVVARGLKEKLISLETVQLRDFSKSARRNVDDHPAGGGDGMVIRPDVTLDAINSVRTAKSYVVHLTPTGKVFDRETAKKLAQKQHLIFLCGRYAGFDDRVIANEVDLNLSIGDFILSGGELACLCVIDSVARYVPGVLGNSESPDNDSFKDGLLEAPSYTKPATFEGLDIPPVLLSGDHKKIAAYRREQSLILTAKRRPDLVMRLWDKLTKAEKSLAERAFKQSDL